MWGRQDSHDHEEALILTCKLLGTNCIHKIRDLGPNTIIFIFLKQMGGANASQEVRVILHRIPDGFGKSQSYAVLFV